ncbi:MAG: ATP phosphoribosyltransferase regulatory subunit [Lachnospiraceae bacterium]|nr:ATP phosphoribosyltransferase regulatory subunit [Lachnospiraceae bacterium]
MKMNLLHTPDGVRDIYNVECAKKHTLEKRLRALLRLYGYEEIQTPSFEFFDIFNTERGTVSSREMFKFIDRDGNTLVLRPDITPSIARAVAKYYGDEQIPMRFAYTGNTFKNNTSYQGRMREITQLGAEFIGSADVWADAEMIALSIELLKEAGLKEFQVDMGHVSFFKALMEEACIDEETEEQIRILIENKNYFGIEDLLDKLNIEDELKEVIKRLPKWFGSVDIIREARAMTKNEKALCALDRLEMIYEILGSYGLQNYVTIDLGMLSEYNYYTGVIFRGYTYGTGDAVVKGGRYDSLLGQFGKKAASVGFAVVIDQLMLALSRQKIDIPLKAVTTMILYPETQIKTAILLSQKMHRNKQATALMCRDESQTITDYMTYSKKHQLLSIYHILDDQQLEQIDVRSGSMKKCLLSEI